MLCDAENSIEMSKDIAGKTCEGEKADQNKDVQQEAPPERANFYYIRFLTYQNMKLQHGDEICSMISEQ